MDDRTGLPASLPAICAPREKLLRFFDHAAERQIVYIQAPGGYGKTVSTLLWLKRSGKRVSWHCFDEYDNTPSLFYLMFCRLLLSVLPQAEKISGIADNPAFRDASVEFTIELLIKADFGREKIILVFDDFHTIINETVIKSLPYVLKRLPDNITVFLLSRSEVPDSFNTLRNINKLSIVDVSELAFSNDEIIKHLASYGRFASHQEAETIRTYSEGWIIVINMMAVSGSLDIDIRKSHASFISFFEKNFWNTLNDEKRRFLLETSIPDTFTLEMCETLTGRKNCAEILDMLIRDNANLSLSNGVYRYHQLFREALHEKMTSSDIDLPDMHRQIAEYYLERNDIAAGRRHAVKSGNYDIMAKSVRAIYVTRDMNLDEYMNMTSIYSRDGLPESVCDAIPVLYLSKVFAAYLSGNIRDFLYYFDKIYNLLPKIAEEFPQLMEANVTNTILDHRFKFFQHEQHVRSMPPIVYRNETDQVTSIGINLPFLHRSSRDCHELTDPSIREAVVNNVFRSLLKYDCDNLFLGIEAGLLIEQNQLDEAREVLLRSANLLSDKVSIDLGWATYIMLAEVALHKNDRKAYERYTVQAREYAESRQAFYYSKNFLAYEARTRLWNGDRDTAIEWLGRYFVNQSNFNQLYKVFQNFTTARAFLVLGQIREAVNALTQIREMGEAFGRPLDVAEADTLLSIAEWSAGKKMNARERLYNQLTALYSYRFIRIVANEGKSVLPIIASILNRLEKDPEKDNEFYRFVKEVQMAAYEQSKWYKGVNTSGQKAVSLSKQQAHILDLLSKGYKNAQIIEIDGISLNTIRYHTRIIYQKLEVTNAKDAVVRAKELGLLK